MIEYIKIEGFKSIKKLELELKSLNILIGGNGSGKSNFISFFKLLNAVANSRLQRYLKEEDVDRVLYFGRKTTEKLYGKVIFSKYQAQNNGYYFHLAQNNTGGLFVDKEAEGFGVSADNDTSGYFVNDTVQERDTTVPIIYGGNIRILHDQLDSLRIFHFHDTSNTSALRKGCDIADNSYLKPDARNLPAMLYLIKEKHPKLFNQIEKTIISVAPYIEKLILEPSNLNEREIELRWVDKGDLESNFSAYDLSDGTIRFIALATLLLQPIPPSVIVIDEPELGLHPFAISKLSAMMHMASKDSQLIVATQSSSLISNFSPDDVVVVDRSKSEKQSIFKRLNEDSLKNWLEDYTLGDLWERNIINAAQPFEK